MALPMIKAATPADEAAVIAVITLAFSTDPVTRWVRPDPQQYLTHFPTAVRAFGGKAFAHGSAYYVEGYAGAALWLPPEVQTAEEEQSSVIQSTVGKREQGDRKSVV